VNGVGRGVAVTKGQRTVGMRSRRGEKRGGVSSLGWYEVIKKMMLMIRVKQTESLFLQS
jgi:hypothetical protein